MKDFPTLFSTVIVAFLSWFFTSAAFFYFSQKLEKIKYLPVYYIVLIVVNFLLTSVLVKFYGRGADSFEIMAATMSVYFVLQFIVFKFLYQGDVEFLNFWEYMVPMFITASVVYFTSIWLRG